jgi:hypothetical protein
MLPLTRLVAIRRCASAASRSGNALDRVGDDPPPYGPESDRTIERMQMDIGYQ